MIPRIKHFYEFGQFRIDEGERLLLRRGEPVPLAPKVFDTLLALVKNRGHVLGKETLMQELWPDTFVEESNLKIQHLAVEKGPRKRRRRALHRDSSPTRISLYGPGPGARRGNRHSDRGALSVARGNRGKGPREE